MYSFTSFHLLQRVEWSTHVLEGRLPFWGKRLCWSLLARLSPEASIILHFTGCLWKRWSKTFLNHKGFCHFHVSWHFLNSVTIISIKVVRVTKTMNVIKMIKIIVRSFSLCQLWVSKCNSIQSDTKIERETVGSSKAAPVDDKQAGAFAISWSVFKYCFVLKYWFVLNIDLFSNNDLF